MEKNYLLTKLTIAFLVGLGLALLYYTLVKPTFAKKPPDLCKKENAECRINSSNHPCCEGLYCKPFNEHSQNGKCKPIEVTPTPTCEPEPTPTEVPEPTPTDIPEPTPTKAPVVTRGLSPAGAPICVGEPVTIPPHYVSDSCVSLGGGVVACHWVVTDPHSQGTEIHYGLTQDNLNWSAEVKGHDINFMKINLVPAGHFWFEICSEGACGDIVCGSPLDPIVK